MWEDDAPKRRSRRRAEGLRRLLELGVELLEHRLHRSHDERESHEHKGEDDRRPRERHVDAYG